MNINFEDLFAIKSKEIMHDLVPECDAATPSIYSDGKGGYICRCIICGHCGHHTGNATQGHYWKFCKVLKKFHNSHKDQSHFGLDCKECLPDFHFCCPGNCELFNEDGTEKLNARA